MTQFSLFWAEEQLKLIYKTGVMLVPTYRAVEKTEQADVLNLEECLRSKHRVYVNSAVSSSPPPAPPSSFGLFFSVKKRDSGADWRTFPSVGDDVTRN